MTAKEYREIKEQGYGKAYCVVCQAETDHTHDEYGSIFCVSCGEWAHITYTSEVL